MLIKLAVFFSFSTNPFCDSPLKYFQCAIAIYIPSILIRLDFLKHAKVKLSINALNYLLCLFQNAFTARFYVKLSSKIIELSHKKRYPNKYTTLKPH